LSDRHVYYRAAAGGVGTVVVEEASVHGSDWPYERAPLAALAAPGWAAIASARHEEGALVIAAIGHAGGQGSSAYSQAPLWAPSRVPEVNSREVPKAMEESDIAAVVDAFADAARAAVRSGCDGSRSTPASSRCAPVPPGLTNHRGDEGRPPAVCCGGARGVRAAVDEVDSGAIVGLRLSADELVPWAASCPRRQLLAAG
jgi:2,4-dienoyl-CoA reductase (NADPH2)